MIEAPEAIRTQPPAASSQHLRWQLAALRRKHVVVAVLTGLALLVAVGVELLAVVMFLDWWLDLPWGVRLFLLLGQLAILGYILARQVVLPLLRQPDEDSLALMVEKARPEFRTRLIASVQLSRPGSIPPGAAVSLVDALLVETKALSAPQDFRAIVPTDRLKTLGFLALIVLALGLGGLVYGRAVCYDLLQRAFLSQIPVPRKTRVVILDGNKVVGRGDNVRIEAYAQGIIPAEGKLEVKYRHRRIQQYTVEQNVNNPIHFGRTLESVQDSFDYVVYLNDGVSPTYTVKAIPRPTVAKIECTQEFPAYSRLPTTPRSLGDLTLLAGSRLYLTVTATKDIEQASVRLVGLKEAPPLQVQPGQSRTLTGGFLIPAKGLTGFSIQLLDTDGMESRDAAVYRVEILPDKSPQARLTYPDRKEELVTRLATLLVGMDITDDFQINKVQLHYKVDTLENGAEKAIELDLGQEQVKRLQRAFPWKLSSFDPPLTEGSMIEFWIEAEDNNDATGPGRGASEHQLARVVSRDEKLADALNRASDYLSGIEDVAEDQARANRNLGDIILEKASP
jgi:hypothetical protein